MNTPENINTRTLLYLIKKYKLYFVEVRKGSTLFMSDKQDKSKINVLEIFTSKKN